MGSGVFEKAWLGDAAESDPDGNLVPLLPAIGLDLRDAVESFENQLIVQALERTSWNKKQAARLLGLPRTTLLEMLKRKRIGPGTPEVPR